MRLQEVKPVYDKGQDAIILNRESNWQTQVFQQTESYLRIQQYTNQRRGQMESCFLD